MKQKTFILRFIVTNTVQIFSFSHRKFTVNFAGKSLCFPQTLKLIFTDNFLHSGCQCYSHLEWIVNCFLWCSIEFGFLRNYEKREKNSRVKFSTNRKWFCFCRSLSFDSFYAGILFNCQIQVKLNEHKIFSQWIISRVFSKKYFSNSPGISVTLKSLKSMLLGYRLTNLLQAFLAWCLAISLLQRSIEFANLIKATNMTASLICKYRITG